MKRIILTLFLLALAVPNLLAQELVLDYPHFLTSLDTVLIDFKVVENGQKLNLGTIDKSSISLQRSGYNGTEDVTSLANVIDIRNYDPDYTAGNYSIIVLADRSVTQDQLDAQRQAILELFKTFPKARFFITAMDDQRTPTAEIQDYYQLSHWIDSCLVTPSTQEKFIYKAMASVLEEVTDTEAHDFYPETPYNPDLRTPGKKVLFVMTNGVSTTSDGSYIGGEDFFRIKMSLISELNQKKEVQVNVVWFGDDIYREEFQHEVQYVFKDGDLFFPTFDAQNIKEQLILRPDPDAMDYRMVLVNDLYRLYDGQKVTLHAYLDHDGVEAYGARTFTLGTLIDPIPVQSTPKRRLELFAMCVLIGLALTGIAYLFFRFIFPKWRFKAFKRRYVKRFEKSNVLPNRASDYVAQKCYYCKEPFQPGDEIVTRCEHTMHYECWKENGCQCPEYGHECDNGPINFDEDHPTDRSNTPFFLKWFVAGCLSGIVGWLVFRLCTHHNLFHNLILNTFTLTRKAGIDVTGTTFADKIQDMMLFGLIIGFFVTLGAAWLIERRKKTPKRVLVILGRAIAGAVGGFLVFLLGGLIALVAGKDYNSFIVDIIPWLLMGGVVGFAIAYRNEVPIKKAVISGVIFSLIGFCLLYLLSFDNSDFEVQHLGLLTSVLCMVGVMIFASGLYATIAIPEHHSEHYFLHIDGNLKSRDVAIYKWMNRIGGNRMVTIGRHDRCYINMDWDPTEGIDGPQAEVYLENEIPYCKILSTNQVTRLTHGSSFRIGNTTFTYIEKDRN